MVLPSGALFATASTPMLPPAPGRFSTTTGWPRRSDIGTAMLRATRSALPPGGKLTMKRIGFDGHCAWAAPASAISSRKTGKVPIFQKQEQPLFFLALDAARLDHALPARDLFLDALGHLLGRR